MQLDIIHTGDCETGLSLLPDGCVDCIVTSPPYYGLRDYGMSGQIGLEETPQQYVNRLVKVFDQGRRVLKQNGTLWLNLGDSYAGSGKGRNSDGTHSQGPKQQTNTGSVVGNLSRSNNYGIKAKDLIGIPWMVAFALRNAGWYLRQDIIWSKPSVMPESVKDRCTKSHEYIFLLSKNATYHFDYESIKEPVAASTANDKRYLNGTITNNRPERGFTGSPSRGAGMLNSKAQSDKRNKRTVWHVANKPFREAHFATFPPALITDCIKAGCPTGGVVLDPFMGAGTTAVTAWQLGRRFIGYELNPEYVAIAEKRLMDYILT
jgi:DNA modification methylase